MKKINSLTKKQIKKLRKIQNSLLNLTIEDPKGVWFAWLTEQQVKCFTKFFGLSK